MPFQYIKNLNEYVPHSSISSRPFLIKSAPAETPLFDLASKLLFNFKIWVFRKKWAVKEAFEGKIPHQESFTRRYSPFTNRRMNAWSPV